MEIVKKLGLVSFNIHRIPGNIVNATAMAVSFHKKPSDWLRLKSTRNFLTGLAAVENVPAEELVLKIKKNDAGGREEGVWVHEDAALEFVRWLSPSFAIWNNHHTKDFLLHGKTERTAVAESLLVIVSDLIQRMKESGNSVDEQARKALYHDVVLQSRTLIPVTLIAKEAGMSATALNKWLHEKKIIYKKDTHWVLYADYQGKGYTGTKTALYIDSQGKYQSNIHTYWTEKGRGFIHTLLRDTKQIA